MRRCYEGVERDGEVIRVRDTVLLRSGPRKKSLPYVAKISALWEDPKTGEEKSTGTGEVRVQIIHKSQKNQAETHILSRIQSGQNSIICELALPRHGFCFKDVERSAV